MTSADLHREEAFHDEWAEQIDVNSYPVDEHFTAETAPEGRFIAEWLGDVRGKRLLDLGCGAGEAAVYFAKQGAIATASDLSPGMLQVAHRLAARHGVTISTAQCPSDVLPFPDGSFDIVYAGNVLHHVDAAATMDEVRRVLVKGGAFVSWDPLAHNPLINIYRRMATDVRTVDEAPLKISDVAKFRSRFATVETRCFWLCTLWLFIRFYAIERVDPNKERYWKKIIKEHKRLATSHRRLARVDAALLRIAPFLRRYCWNIAVCSRT